jgi:biopolymer transport protein ExbD
MRVPLTSRISLVFILIGVALYAGHRYWVATRTWVPLDMPISLSRGHIRTGEFEINLEGSFWVYVEVERKFDFDGVPCLLGYGFDNCEETPHGVLKVSWTLSEQGRVVAKGTSDSTEDMLGGSVTMGRGLGRFWAGRGEHYVLEVEVLEDGSRLNPGHPRLKIEQTGYDWSYQAEEESIYALALFFAAVGAALLASSLVARSREKQDAHRVSLTAPGPLEVELRMKPEPSAAQVTRPKSRLSLPPSAWFGLGLFLLGGVAFTTVQRWMDTRIFVPVDMPVSLAAGHIRTGPFRINLKGGYLIQIDTGQWWQVDPQCVSYNILRTQWVLYRQGKVVEHHEPVQDSYYSGFDANEGVYDLDVEVLADASCLNAGHPRLRVATSRTEYEFRAAVAQWPAALCVAVGASLLVLAGMGRIGTPSEKRLSITGSETVSQNFQWAQKLPLRRPISGLPGFGLVGGFMFAIFAMLMMMLVSPLTPKGLWVHLLKPGAVPTAGDAWTEPIMVRVEAAGQGQPPNLYVNSKPVAWQDLDRVLKQQLSLRREWTVYVNGDDTVGWSNVANVIDAARGYHAKVYLVTGDAGNGRKH